MQQLSIKTTRRIELIDITQQVQAAVSKTGIDKGICVVFCPHTTAGLTINENADPSVKKDISAALAELIPEQAGYSHAEGNSDSHIKSSLFGSSLSIIIDGCALQLGTWQGVYFCESDGPRQRVLWVKAVKG
jgi:secondary thiamine-phosphate synthase enzyme